MYKRDEEKIGFIFCILYRGDDACDCIVYMFCILYMLNILSCIYVYMYIF